MGIVPISGIPVVLALRTRMEDPCVHFAFQALSFPRALGLVCHPSHGFLVCVCVCVCGPLSRSITKLLYSISELVARS